MITTTEKPHYKRPVIDYACKIRYPKFVVGIDQYGPPILQIKTGKPIDDTLLQKPVLVPVREGLSSRIPNRYYVFGTKCPDLLVPVAQTINVTSRDQT